jgi:hypothetical protein
MRSLLRQGTTKLARFARRRGVTELRDVALRHAEAQRGAPPKIMLNIEGFEDRAPASAIRITIPRR